MKQMKYKALISDVDWTLLDSEQFIFQAYLHALEKFHLPAITLEQLLPHMGKPIEQCYDVFAPGVENMELIKVHRAFQAEHLDLAVPYPHTVETLKRLFEKGIKIAAVTTRSEQNLQKTLEISGLMPFIEIVIPREDLKPEELKPHPRPVLLALERLHVSPEQTISIGDAKEDIASGKSAGTKTIGVTYGSAGEKIRESNPDYVINDIEEIIPILIA
ncbi:MAG: HAD family hydrolase [Candidatus Levyibacteriota bacterium]